MTTHQTTSLMVINPNSPSSRRPSQVTPSCQDPYTCILVTNDISILRSRRSLLQKRARVFKQTKRSLGGPSRNIKSTAPRMFTCQLESCGKVFSDRASLKKHLTVHGDKLVIFSFIHTRVDYNVVLVYIRNMWKEVPRQC
jgi:hypothetical protein